MIVTVYRGGQTVTMRTMIQNGVTQLMNVPFFPTTLFFLPTSREIYVQALDVLFRWKEFEVKFGC